MKEIVINTCYGGFGLSAEAIREYLKLLNKEPFFYIQTKNKYSDGINEYTRIENTNGELFVYILLKDIGEKTNELDYDDAVWFSDRDIPRDDKYLVSVVKKLGKKAFGSFAKLKIVKIPNDVEWEIEEHDGFEEVAEKHRTWE